MNKEIKIIDLLNKIANNEELPKEIKFRNIIFKYDSKICVYYDVRNNNEKYNDLLMELSNYQGRVLNDKVEIIEEDNKIEDGFDFTLSDNIWTAKQASELIDNLSRIEIRINKKLLDEINKLKDDK